MACRLLVFNTLIAVFDEPFLLDCLNEFNLSYLINQRSDPLNVSPTENLPSEKIFSWYLYFIYFLKQQPTKSSPTEVY